MKAKAVMPPASPPPKARTDAFDFSGAGTGPAATAVSLSSAIAAAPVATAVPSPVLASSEATLDEEMALLQSLSQKSAPR